VKILNPNDFGLNTIAKLAALGSAIAAVMALEESILADARQQQDQKEQEQKFQKMQKQIDDLTT
jgi:sensor domain CHASE-containing protein